ncbi:hypothetical protein [Dactylosporangium sp. NPDC048998]|uniref:hypothetical protein n=1 Tax=Dactylosporangium sp. NPDC048998 TaxID=3363976 RepID=UPI0037149B60
MPAVDPPPFEPTLVVGRADAEADAAALPEADADAAGPEEPDSVSDRGPNALTPSLLVLGVSRAIKLTAPAPAATIRTATAARATTPSFRPRRRRCGDRIIVPMWSWSSFFGVPISVARKRI